MITVKFEELFEFGLKRKFIVDSVPIANAPLVTSHEKYISSF